MADWNLPVLTSTYTDFLDELKARDVDLATMTFGTNPPLNAIRRNSSTGQFEKWNGSAWEVVNGICWANRRTDGQYVWIRRDSGIPFFATRCNASDGVIALFNWSSESTSDGAYRAAIKGGAAYSAFNLYYPSNINKQMYMYVSDTIALLNAYDYSSSTPLNFQIGYNSSQKVTIPALLSCSHLIETNVINCVPSTGQQLILNAGESYGKVSGQTGEAVYINAENGLKVNTPDAAHSNWQSGYTVETTSITGNGVTTKQLHLTSSQDASLSSSGALVIGSLSSANLTIDNNEIMTRNNGSTSPLYLNSEGGDVHINNQALNSGDLYVKNKRVWTEDYNGIKGSDVSNACVGYGTFAYLDSASNYNTAVGANALSGVMNDANNNTAVGFDALFSLSTGDGNTAIGYKAGLNLSSASGCVLVGADAGYAITSGMSNVCIGTTSGYNITTGAWNTCIGEDSGDHITTGQNNICIGLNAGNASSPYDITTQFNRIVMGNNDITNAYIKVNWTVTSDKRDKTDVQSFKHGLDYITQLKPVTFRFDDRSRYKDGKRNGKKKDEKKHIGFIAQDIEKIENALNLDEHYVVDNSNPDKLGTKETALIPILVNAIKELKAELDELKAKCCDT